MIRFKITRDTFSPGMRVLGRRIPEVIRREITGATRDMGGKILIGAPVGQSGELKRSFVTRILQGRRFTSGVFGTFLFYGRFLEFGTKRGIRGRFWVSEAVAPFQRIFPDRLARSLRQATRS